MLMPGNLNPVGFGFFSIFAVIGGLTLLVGTDHAAPGCTGPAVQRCDYIATAKFAVARSGYRPFTSDLGF